MSDDILARVRTVVAGVAKIDDVDSISVDRDLYKDLGVQSTAALDLLLSLEDEFGISVEDDAFGDARTVALLVKLVESAS